jgi:26S proteasome regulatory subunit, ATPase 3, interacting protein
MLISKGKQSVYHVIQDPKDNLTPEELSSVDKDIELLRTEISEMKTREKTLNTELNALNAIASISELKSDIVALSEEKVQLEQRLTSLQSGTSKTVSAEEKAEVDKSLKLWIYKEKLRKKACMELWGTLYENLPEGKTKEEFWDELGLEKPT